MKCSRCERLSAIAEKRRVQIEKLEKRAWRREKEIGHLYNRLEDAHKKLGTWE